MTLTEPEVLRHFSETNALRQGHFVLRSGLHSDRYFQAALLLQHTKRAAQLCGELARRFAGVGIDLVISPAVGGIVVGQEVGRTLEVRAIFAEKDDQSEMILRRGFEIGPGERVLVAEDVITRGGRVQQTLDLVRRHGGVPVGGAVLVDRSAGTVDFGVPTESLAQLELAVFSAGDCPLCRQGIPVEKPGSK